MKNDESKNSLKYWNNMHIKYDRSEIKVDDWLDSFIDIINRCSTPIIDLGCGSGNDTLYLIEKGKKVIACDQSINAIENIKKNFPEIFDAKCFNMLDGLPFDDKSYDLIIADLSLHYFREEDTFRIIQEINRVLTKDGYLLFRVNSINDVNHGAGIGKEVEHHLYTTDDNRLKRFFNKDDILYFFSNFKIKYLNEETMDRYEKDKRLYRGCVKNDYKNKGGKLNEKIIKN